MRIAVVFLIVSSMCCGFAFGKPRNRNDMGRLFAAIKIVETGHRTSNYPVGDQGRSHGGYQIQYGYWKDAGVKGRYEQVDDLRYSKQVMLAYWQKYCPKALARGDFEVLARTHNGGPGGPRNPKTLPYWRRVQRQLDVMKR